MDSRRCVLRVGLIGMIAIGLAACGDEEGSLTETAQATTVANRPPVISGVPGTVAYEDELYTFTPTASDPDGDSLAFGIEGKPGWATFDTRTGRLSGRPRNADRGRHRDIVIWVSDGQVQSALPTTEIEVMPEPVANDPPQISGVPSGSVTAGQFYDFIPVVFDPNGDPLTFTIENEPAWAQFDPQIGRLFGTPGLGDVGSYGNVVIGVSDGITSGSLAPFVIVVNPPPSQNTPPTISGTPAASVFVGNRYSFTPTATDVDGDTLRFSVIGLPGWALFNAATGAISGTPGPGHAGVYGGISIVVSDGVAQAALTSFSIEVMSGNSAPTIGGTPPSSVRAGGTYTFVPTANDADGDTLSFSGSGLPSWARVNPTTGALSGTPSSGQVGTYANLSITVSDGEDSATLGPFSIEVSAANSPPTISGTPPGGVTAGQPYNFVPVSNDANGDALTFAIQSKPGWAQFDPQTGRLFGTPGAGAIGTYRSIVISVSDGTASSSLGAFSIVVSPPPSPNTPPTISGTPTPSVVVGAGYSFLPTASDADGDGLSFSAAGLPSWANLNVTNGALTGFPAAGDVGVYANVSITVTDGAASATLGPFSIEVLPVAFGTATLTWTPPTQNTDGSALTDLAGYIVYWGTTSGNYSNSVTLANPGLTNYVVDNLNSGTTYFFATKAYNSDGMESSLSNEASKAIP